MGLEKILGGPSGGRKMKIGTISSYAKTTGTAPTPSVPVCAGPDSEKIRSIAEL